MQDWDSVVAWTIRLPDVVMAGFYGVPVPKLNGKALVSPGREAGSFCLMVDRDEKEVLLATEPNRFWQTGHYEGWPAVLVRYGPDTDDRVATHIRRRWWDCARPAQRAAFGPRP